MPTFANTIDNNEILAKRSQCDYAGNDIQTTYATKSEIVNADWDAVSGAPGYIENKPVIPEGVPTYTAAEEGKVLGVVEVSGSPALDWVQGGGNSNVFFATFGTTTFQEVSDAYTAGKILVVVKVDPYGGNELYIYSSQGYNRFDFAKFNASGTGTACYTVSTIKVTPNGWYIANALMYGVPETSVPSIPNGAVLTKTGSNSIAWKAPTTGGVTDVEVDGVSVVSGGVASITMPTVDQTYDGTSADAQSGVAIAGEIANIAQVPAITSSDDAKVLTAAYSGGAGSYSWETPAGLFIAQYGISTYAEVKAAVGANKDVYCDVNPSSSNKRMAFLAYIGSDNFEFQYYRSNSSASGIDSVFVYKVDSRNKWTTTERAVKAGNMPTVDQTYNSSSTNAQSGVAVAGAIANVNQVPASTSSDEGKVLTVDANGDPGWATGGGGGGAQADWTEDDPTAPSYIENKPVPKTLTAGTGISITESASTITIANTAPDLPIGSWEDVSTEAQYNTTPVLAGGFEIKYNSMLKLVSVTADVNLDAGAANIFTWSNRLKPVANAFALGNGLTLYVSQTSLNQSAAATNRWVNGVWMWPVVGE